MDSVADVTDEEAYVEDEPEIKYEDDSSIKQDAVIIEGLPPDIFKTMF